MKPKETILSLLPKLSPEELKVVKTSIQAVEGLLLGTSSTRIVQSELSEDWLLQGLLSYMQTRGSLSSKGKAFYMMKSGSSYRAYIDRKPVFYEWAARVEKGLRTTTRHRTQLAYVCAMALGNYLDDLNIYSVPTMLKNVDKIPEAMEKAFPGYMVGNLLPFVIGIGKGNDNVGSTR